MSTFRHLTPLDPSYPSRLRKLPRPPATITIHGASTEAERAVAIVGSRAAHPEAAAFARSLAATLVRAGVVVVSGGAMGIDAAAHRGALDAGGRTWAVAGTGCDHCFPSKHAPLYAEIASGPGAMVWPFAPSRDVRAGSFVLRNKVLVGLSDAVVVVQAGLPSGALNAAFWAARQHVPLWVVPSAPWMGRGYAGSRRLLEQGARPLHAVDALLASLGLGVRRSAPPPSAPSPRARRPCSASPLPSPFTWTKSPPERNLPPLPFWPRS